MVAPVHTLNEVFSACQGLPRRCLELAQDLARACLGLAQGTPKLRPFCPHSTVLVNHGRKASIHVVERPSLPIHDFQPPLPKGSNGKPAQPEGRGQETQAQRGGRRPSARDHGRKTSINAIERRSVPIDDSHPPLPKGDNRSVYRSLVNHRELYDNSGSAPIFLAQGDKS
jgi:hypothetical protein